MLPQKCGKSMALCRRPWLVTTSKGEPGPVSPQARFKSNHVICLSLPVSSHTDRQTMRRKSWNQPQPLVSVVSGKGLSSLTRTCGVDKREKVRDDYGNNKVLARSVCKTTSHCYFKLSGEHSFWALGFQTLTQSVKRLGREKDLCVSEQAILFRD